VPTDFALADRVVTFHADAGETYRIVPGGSGPDLVLVGEPKRRQVGPRRKRTTFRVRAINRGDGPTGPIDLIARAPKERLRVRGPKRRKIANIAPGASNRQAFELRIRKPARGKVTKINFLARGPDVEDRETVVRLRVRD
jgi:hypothetical protein